MFTTFAFFYLISCIDPSSCADCSGNGQDLDGDGVCDTCDSGDTGTAPDGAIHVTTTVLGSDETMNVIVDGQIVGQTGQDIAMPPGDYKIMVGDDPKVTSSDKIPYHAVATWSQDDTWNNSNWIHPPVAVTVSSGKTTVVKESDGSDELVMNHFVTGDWTCDNGHSKGTSDVKYTEGYKLFLDKIDDMFASGVNVASIDYPTDIYGAFTSPSIAEVTLYVDSEASTHFYCWLGNEEDDPRTTAN